MVTESNRYEWHSSLPIWIETIVELPETALRSTNSTVTLSLDKSRDADYGVYYYENGTQKIDVLKVPRDPEGRPDTIDTSCFLVERIEKDFIAMEKTVERLNSEYFNDSLLDY